MNIAQKKAIAFIRKYKLNKKTFNRDTMKGIFEQQGYRLFRFVKGGRSSDEVENFLENRSLAEAIHSGDCKEGYTSIRGNDRVVLVNSRLSEDNELHVLLHEQGHISFNHLAYRACDGVQCEREADAFAFYVMHYLEMKEHARLAAVAGAFLFANGVYKK